MVVGGEVVAASDEVRDLVARYVFYDVVPIRSGSHLGLPGSRASITISFGAPITRLDPISGAPLQSARAVVGWPTTQAASIRSERRERGVAIELTMAGLRELIGVDLAATESRAPRLDDVASWSTVLVDRLIAAATTAQRSAILDETLARNRNPNRSLGERWRAAHSLIVHPLGPSIAHIADYIGSSRQHLTRTMRSVTGLDPTTLRQLARLERSASLVSSMSATQVAHSCGYSDQPHMNRDWNTFVGCTPRQWAEREPDSVRHSHLSL